MLSLNFNVTTDPAQKPTSMALIDMSIINYYLLLVRSNFHIVYCLVFGTKQTSFGPNLIVFFDFDHGGEQEAYIHAFSIHI